MGTITEYTFIDENDLSDGWSTQNYAEAREYAQRFRLAVVANTYTWMDSEPLLGTADFRPTAEDEEDGDEEVEADATDA